MNGFNPEVQNFMLSLIMEVVTAYDVDGIQGDDRMPAMPVESGYDDYTVSLFKQEHNGQLPPQNFRDTAWVNWRADKMTCFMRQIYQTVKAKKNILISMSPSIFPCPVGKRITVRCFNRPCYSFPRVICRIKFKLQPYKTLKVYPGHFQQPLGLPES